MNRIDPRRDLRRILARVESPGRYAGGEYGAIAPLGPGASAGADREEYDQQRLARAAFEQREAEHNRTIKQMMDEIEADLGDLGFDVERSPV